MPLLQPILREMRRWKSNPVLNRYFIKPLEVCRVKSILTGFELRMEWVRTSQTPPIPPVDCPLSPPPPCMCIHRMLLTFYSFIVSSFPPPPRIHWDVHLPVVMELRKIRQGCDCHAPTSLLSTTGNCCSVGGVWVGGGSQTEKQKKEAGILIYVLP